MDKYFIRSSIVTLLASDRIRVLSCLRKSRKLPERRGTASVTFTVISQTKNSERLTLSDMIIPRHGTMLGCSTEERSHPSACQILIMKAQQNKNEEIILTRIKTASEWPMLMLLRLMSVSNSKRLLSTRRQPCQVSAASKLNVHARLATYPL